MSDIFISYSKKDIEYATKFVFELRKRDFSVWIDNRIDMGDQWWRTIVEELRKSQIFIVLMTPFSEGSEWVERECMLAINENKRIFPVLINGNVFPLFINRQYTDLLNYQIPSESFYNSLKSTVKNNNAMVGINVETQRYKEQKKNNIQTDVSPKQIRPFKLINIKFPEGVNVSFPQGKMTAQREILKQITRKNNRDDFAICPICKEKVKIKNLLMHYDREHNKVKDLRNNYTSKIISQPSEDVNKNLSKGKTSSLFHGKVYTEREEIKKIAKEHKCDDLIVCPYCKSKVKSKNIILHYDREHNTLKKII